MLIQLVLISQLALLGLLMLSKTLEQYNFTHKNKQKYQMWLLNLFNKYCEKQTLNQLDINDLIDVFYSVIRITRFSSLRHQLFKVTFPIVKQIQDKIGEFYCLWHTIMLFRTLTDLQKNKIYYNYALSIKVVRLLDQNFEIIDKYLSLVMLRILMQSLNAILNKAKELQQTLVDQSLQLFKKCLAPYARAINAVEPTQINACREKQTVYRMKGTLPKIKPHKEVYAHYISIKQVLSRYIDL